MLRRLISLILTYLKPHSGSLTIVVALQVLATVMALYLPNLNARIIDEGVVVGDIPAIWGSGALMLAFTLIQGLAQITAIWFGVRVAMGISRDLRADVFDV